ncbi:MAG: polysaccharide pyruvyl transferase family protein, partial [Clostridia bacterium]|nr:polysaccharide pyruvyl transferase family protein [Clostridia bacterium]
KDPMYVIEEIASCEFIYSSSLHGLILADGFRIPNMRVYFSSAPRGGTFKFDDYYSAYGLQNPPQTILKPDDLPPINSIIDNYMITDAMVNKMQKDLYECMKEFLSQKM